MRVEYLKLKNFVNVFAGMKRTEVEIDFSQSSNNIIVFIGKNGSGKTSLLSELHPFANSGNMDVRSDVNLIMDGCDGYKEIHIKDGNDLYIIKHNYMFANKTKSVKSFISKNGEDLNSNGNVKSFKEIVSEYLGIEHDLLKLMRLGSNVTSLTTMKSTNRKSFATKLFSDLDIYQGFYKKVSEEYKNIRVLMKNLSTKLAKFNINDESEFEKQLSLIEGEIQSYEINRDSKNKEIARLETKMNDIDISDENDVVSRYNTLSIKLSESDILLTLVKDINLSKAEFLLIKEKEKNSIEQKVQEFKSSIEKYISERDIYYTQKQELEESLKNAISDVRIKQLEEVISDYTNKIANIESKLINRTIYDKYELMKLKDNVLKVTDMYNALSAYTTEDIKRVVKSILDGQNIKEYITSSTSKMREDFDKVNAEIINIENLDLDLEGYVIPENSCTDTSCPYKEFYYTIIGKRNNLGSLIDQRNKINKLINGCEELYTLYTLIIHIKEHIDSWELTNSIPVKYNSTDCFMNILNNKPIVNINLLNLAIDDSETDIELKTMKSELDSFKKEYDIIKDYSVDVIDIENKIISIDNIISEKSEYIDTLSNDLVNLNMSLDDLIIEINTKSDALDLKDKLSDIRDEHNVLECRLNEISNLKTTQSEYSINISNLKKEVFTILEYLKSLSSRKERLSYDLQDYKNTQSEYNSLVSEFEDAERLKKALSTTEGIPLLYLNFYLQNCPMMMNNLLENVFDGDLQIDDFIINENEFRIPFINDGVKVPDIIHASQGESSFISIVLSLSLIVQSMTKYDIICLDELDGPLDNKNREEFINILYKFMDIVNCEQVFLISHNNMFDNEPIDIIQTSEYDIDNFKFGNVIFKNNS